MTEPAHGTPNIPKPGEIDQILAVMRDFTPRSWRSLYSESLRLGFTPDQAFALVQIYILSQGRAPVFSPVCATPGPSAPTAGDE